MKIRILEHDNALSSQLDQLCQRIAALDPVKEGPTMFAQVSAARPDFVARFESALQATPGGSKIRGLLLNALGAGIVMMHVQAIPAQVEELVGRIDHQSTSPALRCALVSALAYLVQARDLIPDDAPGSYGLLDDPALLTACLIQVTPVTAKNSPEIEGMKKKLAGLESMLDAPTVAGLQQAIEGLTLLVQSMSMLPAQIADVSIRMLLDNPNIASAPKAPGGWQAPSFRPAVDGGHWSGGAYFEGGNVVIPGGPSLIDGQVFIPS